MPKFLARISNATFCKSQSVEAPSTEGGSHTAGAGSQTGGSHTGESHTGELHTAGGGSIMIWVLWKKVVLIYGTIISDYFCIKFFL